MKSLLLLMLITICTTAGYSQKSKKLATTIEGYVEMYQNPKILMVRSHQDFVAWAKENAKLKEYFADKKLLLAFLSDMKFSDEGLIALKLGKYAEDEGFLLEVSGILGFENQLFGKQKGYYCSGAATCSQSAGSICITRNCAHPPSAGGRFDPQKAMSGW
ncbi:MAG: hypothetical protein IPL46_24215 [Saprospiraceae bacterium]|nr:hypothetical protein [Saprospiraceae bacterium]